MLFIYYLFFIECVIIHENVKNSIQRSSSIADCSDQSFRYRRQEPLVSLRLEFDPIWYQPLLSHHIEIGSNVWANRPQLMGTDLTAILISSVFLGVGFVIAKFFPETSILSAGFLIGLLILNVALYVGLSFLYRPESIVWEGIPLHWGTPSFIIVSPLLQTPVIPTDLRHER